VSNVEHADEEVEIFLRFQDGRAIVAVFLQGRISEREIYSGHGEIICAYCRGSRVDPSTMLPCPDCSAPGRGRDPVILLLADIHIRVTADGYVRFDCEALKLHDFREDLRCTRSRSGHAGEGLISQTDKPDDVEGGDDISAACRSSAPANRKIAPDFRKKTCAKSRADARSRTSATSSMGGIAVARVISRDLAFRSRLGVKLSKSARTARKHWASGRIARPRAPRN
jgi:hypothetical protein